MDAKYDNDVDVLRISWGNTEIEESDAISAGVILDYDAEGNVIGIEILNASQKIKNFQPELQKFDSSFGIVSYYQITSALSKQQITANYCYS